LPRGGLAGLQVSAAATTAAYDDRDALARFAGSVDVITFEFENVPSATAELLPR
jgi:5-(carboxyamino)imidazole ribonucleotide synthase